MPGLLALQDAKESQLQEPERGYAIPGVSFTAEDGVFFWMFEGKVKRLQLGKEGKVGGSFKHFYFHPYLRKISHLTNIFQMGWNH